MSAGELTACTDEISITGASAGRLSTADIDRCLCCSKSFSASEREAFSKWMIKSSRLSPSPSPKSYHWLRRRFTLKEGSLPGRHNRAGHHGIQRWLSCYCRGWTDKRRRGISSYWHLHNCTRHPHSRKVLASHVWLWHGCLESGRKNVGISRWQKIAEPIQLDFFSYSYRVSVQYPKTILSKLNVLPAVIHTNRDSVTNSFNLDTSILAFVLNFTIRKNSGMSICRC